MVYLYLSCVPCNAGTMVSREVLQYLPSFAVSGGYGKYFFLQQKANSQRLGCFPISNVAMTLLTG